MTFRVQQDPIPAWNESPVPTDYWTRPINDAARSWSPLGGNWLGGAWNNPQVKPAVQQLALSTALVQKLPTSSGQEPYMQEATWKPDSKTMAIKLDTIKEWTSTQ